jgi:hypothetical protein
MGVRPAWLPEYGIDLDPALDLLPADIGGCWNPTWSVYTRRSAKGPVARESNCPGPHGDPARADVAVDPSGGGSAPSDGSAPGILAYTGMQSVQLGAHPGCHPAERPPYQRISCVT